MDETQENPVVYKPTTEKKSSVTKFSKNIFPYFAATIANLVTFESGISLIWPSPVIPKLSGRIEPENNPLGQPLTISQQSWFASLICIGAIIGPFLASWLINTLGRKKTLLVLAIPYIVAYITLAYAKNIYLYYLSRFLCGLSAGSAYAVVPMFLGEISSNHNRGRIGSLLAVFNALGSIYALTIGPYTSIRNFCLLCLMPMFIFVPVLALFIPETPHFLASINNRKELKKSLLKLRSTRPSQVEEEMMEMMKSVQERTQSGGGFPDLLKERVLRKAFIIVLVLMTIQPLCGIGPVMSFMQTIFDSTGSKIPSEISSILVGIVQLCAASLSSSLVDKVGRRILLLLSTIGCFLSLATLGFYFHLKDTNYDMDVVFWLPLICFFVYVVAFCLGLGPLSWVILADLIPANYRAPVAALSSTLCFGSHFVATFIFPELTAWLGMGPSFWVFAMVCFIAVVFVYKVIPETKGKSSQEIQRMLEKHQ